MKENMATRSNRRNDMSNINYTELYRKTLQNKAILKEADSIGCIHCESIIDYNNINYFIDGLQTAICPNCNIDAIIPLDDQSKEEQKAILSKMNHDYF